MESLNDYLEQYARETFDYSAMDDREEKEYIMQFNLGYEMAIELNLTRSINSQDISKAPTNSPCSKACIGT